MVGRCAPALALAICLAGGGQALAHAALDRAAPRVGSTVAASPADVRMWFTEALEPAFAKASLLDPAGQDAAGGGKAFVDPKDRQQLVIPLARPLAPGRYRVKWAVVSVDGHRTQGDFRFTVRASR